MGIVGKGGHTPPFSSSTPPPPPPPPLPLCKILPFLEIQDVPTFYRPIGKTKVLNEPFNRCFLVNFMKNGYQL